MINHLKKQGSLIILSAASGTGKSTISRALLEKDTQIKLSISATTRLPREGEQHGMHYFFLSKKKFEEEAQQKRFAEHAQVYNNFYGTYKESIEGIIDRGDDVLFDIDWQGAQSLHRHYPHHTIRIFILPPSMEQLEQRLRSRHTDSEEVIQSRMKKAHSEISRCKEYEYILINDDLNTTVKSIHGIIKSERLKRHRLMHLDSVIDSIV